MASGSFRPCRHKHLLAAQLPADPNSPILEKPFNLDADAVDMWDRLEPLVRKFCKPCDAFMLAELCNWWTELKRNQDALDSLTPGTPEFTRVIRQAGNIANRVFKLAAKFGLDLLSRQKLGIVDKTPPVARVPVRPPCTLPPPEWAKEAGGSGVALVGDKSHVARLEA